MRGLFLRAPAAFQLQLDWATARPTRGLQLKQPASGATSRRWLHPARLRCRGARPRRAQDEQRGARIRKMSNIVIYEDDGPMRALLKEWLGEAGYRVRAVAEPAGPSAEDADLVIVSVYMPKQAGMQRV